MPTTIEAGAVLMRVGTTLPPSVKVKEERYSRGWNLVKILDRAALNERVMRAGWHLIFLPGPIKARAFGLGDSANVRQAIVRILDKIRARKFNCVGVSEIVRNRFLGFPYVTVRAHAYQLQESNSVVAQKRRT